MMLLLKLFIGAALLSGGLFLIMSGGPVSTDSPKKPDQPIDAIFREASQKTTLDEPSKEKKEPDTSKNIFPTFVKHDAPFISQAPFGEWDDSRQQDGCEEASVIIAVNWAKGVKSISKETARKEILAISDWEEKTYGSYHDTSADDTLERIIKGYFQWSGARVEKNVSKNNLMEELQDGNVIIVPANGLILKNAYYTPPGPEKHMLVLVGYDPKTKEFITEDPGTRQGKDYRYKEDLLYSAIADYPTGDHLPRTSNEKNIIVVEKSS